MRILRKKNITEAAENKDLALRPAQVDKLEPVVDHTTANTLASKEDNEAAAQKNIEDSGINKVADEVVKDIQDPKKDTPAPKTPSLKPYTEAKNVVDRKALSQLIKECKEAGRKYRIKRSLEEGYRYVFEELVEEYPECRFVCHTDNGEVEGYFDDCNTAVQYAEHHPEVISIFKVCDNEEERVWDRKDLPDYDDIEKTLAEAKRVNYPVFVIVRNDDNTLLFWGKEAECNNYAEMYKDDPFIAQPHGGIRVITADELKNLAKTEWDKMHLEEEFEPVPVEDGNGGVKEVCPECGKEVCECNKTENNLDEAIVAPVSEPGDEDEEIEPVVTETEIAIEEPEAIPANEIVPAVELSEPELTVTDPEAEIEIDNIETFVPQGEKAQTTMTTIKDAGDGAMFAFKDTLKDLYNLKIKVSDLQKLLSDSSDWLLDLLGFNSQPEEPIIAPEEIPEPSPEEIAEIEAAAKDDEPAPINDVTSLDINAFDDVEPIDTEDEEDENFFVGD